MSWKMVPALLLAAVFLGVQACGSRSDGPAQVGECAIDTDCPVTAPVCTAQNICVECGDDTDCGCNEVCNDSSCVPLGVVPELLGIAAENLPDRNSAHGFWTGEPGTEDYSFVGFCDENGDCPTGEVCNTFTRGCAPASEFSTICSSSDECPDGLLCDSANDLCLPAALCVSDANCCGTSGLACQRAGDTGASFCLAVSDECTPPTELTSECPREPRTQDACALGEFCNANGRCVQCGCDADCAGSGFPVCDVDAGRCVGCSSDVDCDSNQACDPAEQLCRSRCTNDGDCGTEEFCEPDLGLCRSVRDIPCVQDDREPNQTLDEAVSNAVSLPVPAVGASVEVSELGLCAGDEFDWFTVELERGDTLQVLGRTPTTLTAEIVGIAPDQSTAIDTGRISTPTEPVDIVANFTGTYYLGVARLQNVGNYRLTLSRGSADTGDLCEDDFEDTNGRNDDLSSATLLNDDTATPPACDVNGSLGGSQTIECLGNPFRLCAGEVDYFEILAPPGATVVANVDGTSGDLDAVLYGPFLGDEIASRDRVADSSASVGTNERLEHESRTGGRYYLEVVRSTLPEPTYSITVSVQAGEGCSDDAYDLPDSADPLDPPSFNDAFGNASGIALSPDGSGEATRSVSALNACRLDIDWFRVGLDDGAGGLAPLTPNQELVVTVSGIAPAPDDNVIVFLGDDPTALGASVENPPASASQRASLRPTSSVEYYVAVRPRDLLTGPFEYTLNLALNNPPACTPDDTDDVPADATVLTGSEGRQDDLQLCLDDVAYFNVPLTSEERVIAQVFYDPQSASVATRGYDDDVLGAEVPSGERVPSTGLRDTSELQDEGFQWLDFDLGGEAGDAYVVVYDRDRWASAYDLEVSLAPAQCTEDGFEDNDGWETATPVSLETDPTDRQRQSAFLGPLRVCSAAGGEQDWYAIDLSPGDRFETIFYQSPDEGQLNLRFREPGPDGAASSGILRSIDGPESGARFVGRLDYVVPESRAPGEYLLQVQPLDPAGNDALDSVYFLDFRVRRACPEDPFEPSSETTPFALGSAADFDSILPLVENAALCRDEDWYALEVPVGRTVSVCLDFVHAEGDIDLFVYDDAMPRALVGQSRQNIAPEQVTFDADATQVRTYYLRAALDVNEADRNTTYQLRIAEGSVCP